jgi:hypothetical protein
MSYLSILGKTATLAYLRKSFEQTLGIGDRQRANRALADIRSGFAVDETLAGRRMVDREGYSRRKS